MSYQILILLAMLTLGLAISQRRDQVPCRTVRQSAGRVTGTCPTFVLRGRVPQPSPGAKVREPEKDRALP